MKNNKYYQHTFMSEHTHQFLNSKSVDSHTTDLEFTLDEIINGFSSRIDIDKFFQSNTLISSLNKDQLNQLIWRNELSKRLSFLNVNIEDFDNVLKKHNVKLTGSFLLQIISGEQYYNYDIDLYTDEITNELQNDVMNLFHTIKEEHPVNPKDHKYIEQIVANVKNFIVPNKTFTMKDGSFTEGNPVVGNGVYCAIGGTFDVFETKFVGVSNSQLGVIDVYCNYGGTNTDVYLVAFKNIEGSLVQTDLINLQSESKFERFLNNVNLLSISEDNKIFVSALGDSYYLTNTAELKKDKLLKAKR